MLLAASHEQITTRDTNPDRWRDRASHSSTSSTANAASPPNGIELHPVLSFTKTSNCTSS